jgi:hypothetical protein
VQFAVEFAHGGTRANPGATTREEVTMSDCLPDEPSRAPPARPTTRRRPELSKKIQAPPKDTKEEPPASIEVASVSAKIDFDDAVREGKQIVAQIEKSETLKMRLGELAHQLDTKYGRQSLKRFAQQIGVAVCTLERCRSVFRAWAEISAPAPISFAVAQELQKHPHRAEIIEANPHITKREARKRMQEWSGKKQEPEDQGWQTKETRRWFADLCQRANQAVADAEVAGDTTPMRRKILLETIEPKLLPVLREAGEGWIKLHDYLDGLLKEPRDEAWGE